MKTRVAVAAFRELVALLLADGMPPAEHRVEVEALEREDVAATLARLDAYEHDLAVEVLAALGWSA